MATVAVLAAGHSRIHLWGVMGVAGCALYLVSDLHLGDGTRADRFLHPESFLALLDRVAAEPGAALVIVGDFLELWACELDNVLSRHALLFRRLLELAADHPVTYVVGNHDCLPWYLYLGATLGRVRIVERYTARLGAGTLVAIHGHQYDPFNRVSAEAGQVHTPWTRHLVRVVSALERTGLGGLVNQGAGAVDALLAAGQHALAPGGGPPARGGTAAAGAAGGVTTGDALRRRLLEVVRDVVLREPPGQRDYPLDASRYREAALDWMRQGARWVVMGHTHHPDRLAVGRKVYVNTGCWCWDRYPPTYGRWAGGELTLHDARDGQPYLPNAASGGAGAGQPGGTTSG